MFIDAASGRLTVRLLETPFPDGITLGVYKAPTGNWMPDRNPDPNILQVDIKEAGKYVVQVAGKNGGLRSVKPYRISISRD